MPNTVHLRQSWLLFVLFLLSGFSGLIYQSAWSQQLTLIFGSTELAIAAVLASYMAGLALGAMVIGRFIHRVNFPVRLYAVLELAIALSALAVPILLQWISNAYSYFYTTPQISSMSTHNAIIYVLGSFSVLLIPTTMMGATLPLLSTYAVKANDNFGNKIGQLYAINTLGACMGALFSAFYLLPNFGLGWTINCAVAINVLIFIMGVWFFRTPESQQTLLTSEQPPIERSFHWILPIILVSGSVSFGHEILWTRLLSHMLGSSIYSFGVMLFVFLLAIAFGAFLGSIISKKYRSTSSFCYVQMAIAMSFFISFLYVDHLPNFSMKGHYGSWSFIVESIVIGLITLLPGAIFIGMTFPLAINILAKKQHNAGQVSANIYSWNTIGAIIGSLLMGFYLLSRFGFATSAQLLATTSLVLAMLTLWLSQFNVKATIVLLICTALVWFTPIENPTRLLSYSTLGKKSQKGHIHHMGIGESTTVILMDQGAQMRLLTNGLPESSIQMSGSRDGQYYLAHWLSMLPTLIHPEAKDMLIIGLGAGLTLKAVPDSIKNIDVVELEHEVANANRLLSDWRGIDPLADPRLSLHINDARNAIRNSTQQFDIIVSQPSHPWTAGASNLYTREFFATVKSRLNNEGVFVQWIGMRFIDETLLKSLLATLNAEFNHVALFQPLSTGGLIFVSSQEPIELDQTYFDTPQNQQQWQKLGSSHLQNIANNQRLSAEDSKAFSQGAQLSTDHFNVLKLRSPKIIRKSLNKMQFNQLLAGYDPLNAAMKQEVNFGAIRRLLKEHDFLRVKHLANQVEDPITQNAIMLMTFDEQNRHSPKTQQALMRFWVKLQQSDIQDHPLVKQEIMYHLFLTQKNQLLNNNRPLLSQHINKDPFAAQLFDAWRLLQLRKWKKVRDMETILASITPNHPAYEICHELRLGWRLYSQEKERQQQAMRMIDEQLTLFSQSELLIQKIHLANAMQRIDIAVASLYELKRMLPRKNRQKGLKTYQQLLKKTITEAQKIQQDDFINQHIDKLTVR